MYVTVRLLRCFNGQVREKEFVEMDFRMAVRGPCAGRNIYHIMKMRQHWLRDTRSLLYFMIFFNILSYFILIIF